MIRRNVISGSACLAFGLLVYWLTGQVPAQASMDILGGRFFPRVVTVLFILSSLGLIATGLMGIEISGGQVGGTKGQPAALPESAEPVTEPEPLVAGIPAPTARLMGYVITMAAYAVILPLVGYIVASLLAFSCLIFTTGERRTLRILLGSVAITALLYILFAVIFGMNVPEASLFEQRR